MDCGLARRECKTDKMDECPKCGGKMGYGVAILNTPVGGTPDWPGDDEPVTFHACGSGNLARVLKCERCGFSVGRK